MSESKTGKRLRALRERRNLSQRELGSITGVHYSLINRIERYDKYYPEGSDGPCVNNIIKLADFFGVSVDYILGRVDDESLDAVCNIKTLDFPKHFTRDAIEVWPYNLFEVIKKNHFQNYDLPYPPITNDREEKILEEVMGRFLDNRQIRCIYLYFKDGLTLEEIAKKFKVTRQRVHIILHRACRILSSKYFRRDLKRAIFPEVYDDLECLKEEIAEKKRLLPSLDISKQSLGLFDLHLYARTFCCIASAFCGEKGAEDITLDDIEALYESGKIEKIRNLGRHSLSELSKEMVRFGYDSDLIKSYILPEKNAIERRDKK